MPRMRSHRQREEEEDEFCSKGEVSSLESGAHPTAFIFLQVNTWERGRVAALLSLEVANVNVAS